jgi:enolase
MAIINKIQARQILDSRGNPTVEVDLTLDDGSMGRASVPSGASTGSFEALELRDKESHFLGKSVFQAVNNINSLISKRVIGDSFESYRDLDQSLIELDGSNNKKNLGANAILGVSLAFVHALSHYNKISVHELLLDSKPVMPVPMMNIINGGSHADNNIDIQEFMIFPLGAESFSHSIQIGVEVFHNLKSILKSNNFQTSIGDEGGFAPNLNSNEHAIDVIMDAIHKAGYTSGKDVYIALDVAASELYNNASNTYSLHSENKELNSEEMIEYYETLCAKYPIISIEDGLDENDWEGWTKLFKKLGRDIQLVGDDLTVTNPIRLKKAIECDAMNAILIKLNQIGTITETIDTINMANKANYGSIISHRSGETEDTTIADLSVAMGVGQIKTGSVSRTDRTAKYNQLLRIEESFNSKIEFGNKNYLGHLLK